jgi:ribosomal protein L23
MKNKLFYLMFGALALVCCNKYSFDAIDEVKNNQIKENVEKVFGVQFASNHTWCTTTKGQLLINDIPSDVKNIQVLTYVKEDDGETSLLVLNEANVNGEKSIKMVYDAPSDKLGLYVSFESNGSQMIKKVMGASVSLLSNVPTRAISTPYTLPTGELKLNGYVSSYASDRGWNVGERLYDYNSQAMSVPDYTDEYKEVFRAIIFSYFKNGRKYNNLPLVKESGYYNESAYPFTTGEEPIIVSPVYKNDGGYQEIENSELYYYYYKESDVQGDIVEYIENLPKYKAITLSECINGDDVIKKGSAYALVYWGDGMPSDNAVGSYYFPKGYNIGFMIRANCPLENKKKTGELYGDGRLNNNINNYDKCNFKSSKLGTDGPRICWMTVNGKMLLCFESGTDSDFNDIILEVEGGVDPIIFIPELEDNYYTYCFEDTELGDYDMNDVVIKARKINETTVEYKLVACGAYDELLIKNINGNVINDNTEVHRLFGVDGGYVNTVAGQFVPVVTDRITVNKNFSFLDEDTQPYIVDITTGNVIRLSKTGEDPHGIMIPCNFAYPLEKVCIKDAYTKFNNWGMNPVSSTDWYKHPTMGQTY